MKLRLAQCLMALGITPLILALTWVVSVILYARSHPGQGGGSDAFLMIAVLVLGYGLVLLLALPGAIWSWAMINGKTSRVARILRLLVAIVLALPPLSYLVLLLIAPHR